MPRAPRPDVDVCIDDIRRLLREQHPDLASRPITLLARGWDNVIARVGSDLLARLPRRAVSARLILAEQAWLPVLAPRLPLPVPAPVQSGVPSGGYPFPWSLTPWFPGAPAVSSAGERLDLAYPQAAATLGGFLAALHRPAPPDAPRSASRGVPLAPRAAGDDRNAVLAAAGQDVAHLQEALAAGRAAPGWRAAPVWVHGDLHPANLICHQGRLTAVIDFGDLSAGDPATDLAVAWMFLPDHARDGFWSGYAGAASCLDEALLLRARAWAAALALVFLAHSEDDPQLAAIGRTTSAAVRGT